MDCRIDDNMLNYVVDMDNLNQGLELVFGERILSILVKELPYLTSILIEHGKKNNFLD